MPAARSSRRTLVLCFALACVSAPAAARAQDTLRIPATQPRVTLPAGTRVNVPAADQPAANVQGATQQLVTVPNLSGRTVDEARRLLAAAGLELGRVAEGQGTGTAGTIMQQQPRAGSGVPPKSDVRVWLVPGQQVAVQPPVLNRPPPVTRPPATQEPRRVTVPRLVGRTAQDARVALAAAGLQPGAVQALNVSGTPGTVVRQSPQAGTAVEPGSPVGLWVVAPRQATAPRDSLVRVPDLAGATVEDARERLAAAGLAVGGLADAPGTAGTPGTVARQQPAAGSGVAPATGVRLWLVPARRAVVPAIMGLPLDRAQALLRQSGLRPGDVVGTGRVIGHTFEAGASVPVGSRVNISLGVPPAPPVGQVAQRPDTPAQGETPPAQRPTPQGPVAQNPTPRPGTDAVTDATAVDSLAVPDVRLLALDEARARLEGMGLVPAFDPALADSAAWTVTTQQPGPGARVASGGIVALLLDPPAAPPAAGTTAPPPAATPATPAPGAGERTWVRRNLVWIIIAAGLLLMAVGETARRMRGARRLPPVAGVSARLRMDAPARVAVEGDPFAAGGLRFRVKPGRSAVKVADGAPLFASKEVPVD